MKKSKKGGTLFIIGLLGLFVAILSFIVATRIFLPKMIVRKAEKTETLTHVDKAMNDLNIDPEVAIEAIDALSVHQLKSALNEVNKLSNPNNEEITRTFISNLEISNIKPEHLLANFNTKKKYDEAAKLILQLNKNTNKLHLTLPIIKDTLKESIRKSSKDKTN